MEIYTIYAAAAASLVFIAVGLYLHMLRKKSENVFPAPFLNPTRRRNPRKR
jgi:hypothetical protein